MKNLFIGLVVLSSFIMASCSTMFNGGTQSMMLRSPNNNEGVKVEVKTSSGLYPTKLPATVTAEPSNEGVQITVVDKCYDRTSTYVNKDITPSYWANILNGWGFLIDWATGKMWKYDTSTSVVLNKKAGCVE